MKKQLALLVALSVALPQALMASSQSVRPMHAASSNIRGEVAPEFAATGDMTTCEALRNELEEHQHSLRRTYNKLTGVALVSGGTIATILASKYYTRPLPTALERVLGPVFAAAQTRPGTIILPTAAIVGLTTGVLLYSQEASQLQRWIDQALEDMKPCQQDAEVSADLNDYR